MGLLRFVDACARLQNHFQPCGFEGVMDSTSSMTARIYDTQTAENLVVVAGIPCGLTLTEDDLKLIINAIEVELELLEVERSRHSG